MRRWRPGTLYDRAADTFHARIAAILDRFVAPLRPAWHRSLNGQGRRREMMIELISQVRPCGVSHFL